MIKLNVSIKGFDKGTKKTEDMLKRILMKSMFKMEELAIQKAPVDQGEIRQKITLFPQILNNEYTLTSGAAHSEAMEFGTRPFYAPIKPLQEWAKRKFGDEKIGWAVRAKIAKFGVTAQPFMRPAFHEVKNYWIEQFAITEQLRK